MIVTERMVDALDQESGIAQRWDVREGQRVSDGPSTRVVAKKRDGSLVCSCELVACRHIDAVLLAVR